MLLHRQPDNVWRIDFQLGWDADPVAERQPDRVIPRVQALLGRETRFDLEWVSVYTFACAWRHSGMAACCLQAIARMASRRSGPVVRTAVQDADNLAWKLRLVLQGAAPDTLLDTYNTERAG